MRPNFFIHRGLAVRVIGCRFHFCKLKYIHSLYTCFEEQYKCCANWTFDYCIWEEQTDDACYK